MNRCLELVVAGALAGSAACAVAGPSVSLPAPRLEGAMSVEQALATRRSVRGMAERPLTLAELGQLCWAAQGVTDEKGHRTAPSAMATYPLDVYVAASAVEGLAPGLYHYETASHALAPVPGPGAAADPVDALARDVAPQAWIATAPAALVITGETSRMGERMADRRRDCTCVEAGLAAQGFFLEATALGLVSTYVGGFDPTAARAFLGLGDGVDVLAVLPVGARP